MKSKNRVSTTNVVKCSRRNNDRFMKMEIKMLMQLSWKGCSLMDGGQKVPPLTLNAYNVIKIQPNAAKLCEII